jgi:hypothetical protein
MFVFDSMLGSHVSWWASSGGSECSSEYIARTSALKTNLLTHRFSGKIDQTNEAKSNTIILASTFQREVFSRLEWAYLVPLLDGLNSAAKERSWPQPDGH